MKGYLIYITLIITSLFARSTEPTTGWFYDQSTFQAFYMLQEITIDGDIAEGDGSGAPPNNGACYESGDCDVVGAFIDRNGEEVCVGWVYADASANVTTIPLMGADGSSATSDYLSNGESAYLKIYDSSNGSILDVAASDVLPGFSNNGIFVINGTSTASNTPGCTDESACNYDPNATADIFDECWSATDGCDCEDGQGAEVDCNGVCNGSSELDDCGVCNGNNVDMDCAGVCFGDSSLDNCNVCDSDDSNDDESCTGCTNPDADNFDSANSIDDGSCEFTINGATDLDAIAGPARVILQWVAPQDDFESQAGYTYSVVQNGTTVKTTSQTSTQVTDLEAEVEYCFAILATHNEYGSGPLSNTACAVPVQPTGDPTWRIQLVAELDQYDQYHNTGDPAWKLQDEHNYLGVAADADWAYDSEHDIPEPPYPPNAYVVLYFDHPEWDSNGFSTQHFTEDIVLDDHDFFSTNLTKWNGSVVSTAPGTARITFNFEGDIPENYEIYVVLHDGNGDQSDGDGIYSHVSNGSSVEFYMTATGQQNFSVIIGNIPPQAPDNLSAIGNYKSISLDWDEDGSDLSDIGNRYPATSYNVYRDDEPADPNSNAGTPGNGPGGCGGLLTGSNGQSNSDYHDDVDLYDTYPGEGLLQESTYSYTVTGSNAAGESSEGHTVRMSGGMEEFFDGRDSRTSATTGDNISPLSVLSNLESNDGTNLDEGHYEIPHNYHPDENRITISIDGTDSDDADYPYGIHRYKWSQIAGPNDLQDISGTETDVVTFTVGNPNGNGTKSYTWNLNVETDHPVKSSGSCGVWTSELDTHSDDAEISVTIEEEPNEAPIASTALGLIRGADGISVVTSDDYDESDFNDYDALEQVWYEPHDNDGNDNPADLWFSADQSEDADGKCVTEDQESCDHQYYAWTLTKGDLAGFSYDDLNDNGSYDFGEPFTLQGGDEIYTSQDLGDHIADGPASFPFSGTCDSCEDGVYTAEGPIVEDGCFNYHDRDLHFQREDDVYILSMVVTDIYGASDGTSLVIGVNDERNEAPTAAEHRIQPDWYIAYDDDNRVVMVNEECDGLGANDSDNDDLEFDWSYSGPDNIDLDVFDRTYDHAYGLTPSGWSFAAADLGLGEHTFTFTVTDSYGESDSSSTHFTILNEPGAPTGNIEVVHTDLKYTIIDVSENRLPEFDVDCHGEVYNGADFNTARLDLLRDGVLIKSWSDTDDDDSGTLTHIDESLDAETNYEYTLRTFNSDQDDQQDDIANVSDGTRTHDRPQVDVLTPNGAEIRSIGDLYNVEFSTTQKNYISKIEVFYLRDGENEEPGTDTGGNVILSDNGVNVNGGAIGNDTEVFGISDDSGLEINYDAKIRIRVHDVGDFNGNNTQSHEDDSNNPFTMAAHTLTKSFSAGWHLVGAPLIPWDDILVDNFNESLGNWGADWVSYNANGQYDNLTLTNGEGYYLLLADGETLVQQGDPIIADEDCASCSDNSFDAANVDLHKGWNLIANPLVNKVAKSTLMINDGGEDLVFEDAVDAGWVAPTWFGVFDNGYSPADKLHPFVGYWVHTSRPLTIKVRPHLYEDGELTRKSTEMAFRLDLRANGIIETESNDFISIGMDQNALDDFVYGEDEYDLPQSAYQLFGDQYIDMKLGSDLSRDIRSTEYEDFHAWNVSIDKANTLENIKLSWNDISDSDELVSLVIDGIVIDMNNKNTAEIPASVTSVVIVVGNIDAYLNPIPDAFGLGSAYPNPFNPTTNLELALSQDGVVSMGVYNVRGQLVDMLVDGNMHAGYHTITWNADGISSGMYFVKVQTDANIAIQKLMLLK